MPKSTNQKKKLILLSRIFCEYSDSGHTLTMNDIIDKLASYGVAAERKSIYQDIGLLGELGMDIIYQRTPVCGYYLASREFELPELKLLVDSVCASKFITRKKSLELTEKLSSLASVSERKSLNREILAANRIKTENERIYYSVDAIHEAMSSDRDISFRYFSRNERKEHIYRRSGAASEVSPWLLVWDDNNYYLVAYDPEAGGIRHFRVDKMESVSCSGRKRSGKEYFDKYDISAYTNGMFGMFGGEPETVTLSCDNSLANVIIDRFGSDTVFLNDRDSFRVSVRVAVSPVFLGWLLGFGGKIKVLSPQSVIDKIKDLIASDAVY